MAMINGQNIPPTEGADMNHNQAHRDFMRTDIYTNAPAKIRDSIKNHADGELKYIGFGR
jgi:CRISPR/Cas system CMR-associated protein Cmr5 small subunit